MSTQHESAIDAVTRSIEASESLRACLRSNEVLGRRIIKKLEAGTPISRAIAAAGGESSELRHNTNEFLASYEQCRHELRLAFIGLALDEGVTISQIGKALGTSRQLVARLAKEAKVHRASD